MRTMRKSITAEKESGRFYTPPYIVSNILDLSGYCGSVILKKHVIDNSCGDGAFLCEIVSRYCQAALDHGLRLNELIEDLSTYIHGIELESVEQKKCICNVTKIAKQYGVVDVNWDIVCGNSLSIINYDGKMDFVLGNPPYVRVHNLGDSFNEIKSYTFAQNGMTDLFIVFFELGIRMLNDNGVLGYITPSSYFNSLAGSYMRKRFEDENLLKAVVDLKHFQAFASTTYTAITILAKNKKENTVEYYGYDVEALKPYYVETVSPQDYQIAGNYYFSKNSDLKLLQKIFLNYGKCDISVKNGYATLCDDVFVHDFRFDSKYIIPVIKASKGIKQKIFFPYDEKGCLISESALQDETELFQYLLDNKVKLVNRSNEKDANKYWYAFGRSQAIMDTYKDKLSINALLRTKDDFKFVLAPAGTGVYGGLYIVSDTISIEEIMNTLKSDEFMVYISLLGKYKSGGYYTFSSKDVKAFLDYKFSYDGGILC